MSEPGVGQLRVRTCADGRGLSTRWSHLVGRRRATRRRVGLQPRGRHDQGQILALFGLSLFVLIAVAGLAVDAGGTFAQRRDQQTAVDLAALAGANDYLINASESMATARAESVAAENGFANGVGGALVDISFDLSNGVEVRVAIDAPHDNTFLRIVGMSSWDVSTEASSLAGFPDTGYGAAPFIFSIGAFENDGTPKYQTERGFGDTNGHAPTSPTDFAWTNFGTGNVNTSEVRDIIQGDTVIDRTLDYGQYIGQHNNGNHTALFNDVDTYLSGKDMPVAVVDNNGNFMGWAIFHVIERERRLDQAGPWLLPELVRQRQPADHQLRAQRLSALPRRVRPQAVRLSASSRAASDPTRTASTRPLVSMTGPPDRRGARPARPGQPSAGPPRPARGRDRPVGPAGQPGRRSRARPRRTVGEPALDELDRLDDDDRCVAGVRGLDGGQDARTDRRVDDRLEVAKRARVGEDDAAQGARSRTPSAATSSAPKRAATAARSGLPGARTSRATASASMATTPGTAVSQPATVDLPQPIGPVRPMRTVGPAAVVTVRAPPARARRPRPRAARRRRRPARS